jgi:triosephosphate isomerase (TIM)
MHFLRAEVRSYAETFARGMGNPSAEVVFFPSFPLLDEARLAFAGQPIALGGQDVHPEAKGAFTGDVAAAQLRDAGCGWVLCGHSERRRDHGESDELVGRKAAAAQRQGLRPLVCLGEREEERQRGETFAVLDRQLAGIFASPLEAAGFDIAYEPVWAIGTGETATPETAQEAHVFLRSRLEGLLGQAAGPIRIVYGGSATPENAAALFAQPDVDGFLVGGASLDPAKFLAIIQGCNAG